MARRILLSSLALVATLAAMPAWACMSDGPEGYVSGLIWENQHTNVPEHSIVLKVEVLPSQPESAPGLAAKVIDGPADLAGSTIYLVPIHSNSCVGLGRLAGHVVVQEQPVQSEDTPRSSVFLALDYLPDARDRSRGMKRETNWFFPGDPAPDLFPEIPE